MKKSILFFIASFMCINVNAQYKQACSSCNGSGTCSICYGGIDKNECSSCYGSGLCSQCHGSGVVYGDLLDAMAEGYLSSQKNGIAKPANRQSTVLVDGVKYIIKKYEDIFSIKKLSQGRHAVVYDSSSKYVGSFRNGKKHGHGKFESSGTVVEGNFVNDLLNGHGKIRWANGDYYIGEFKNGNMDGKGVLMENGTKSTGTFSGGFLKPGTKVVVERSDGSKNEVIVSEKGVFDGKLTFPDGRVYIGPVSSFQQPSNEGPGMIYYPNGDVYQGMVNHLGEKNKKGKLIRADGIIYEGEFVRDEYSGYGEMIFKNGDRFGGIFKSGFSDNGTYKFANGDYFSASFHKGKCTGWGLHKEVNGDIYVGDFSNGKKDGKFVHYTKSHTYVKELWKDGVFVEEIKEDDFPVSGTWADGDLEKKQGEIKYLNGAVYVGSLRYGIIDGFGKYIDSDGIIYEGLFFHGTIGDALVTYKDGTKYDGSLKGLRKHGYGKFLYKNKTYIGGKWENDIIVNKFEEGKWKMKDGKIMYKK